jgi:NADH:ubiquinone oxidoreductase subunit 5 (subunit L)/multisubunit Na+/H+ antiporter MnhA subunit
MFFNDLKKNIAFSTSSNLRLMFLMSSMGLYSLVLVHILTHAFVKAGVFMESGVMIHSSGSQDLRVISPLNLGIWLLIGIVVYIISKEIVVIEVGLVRFLLFLLCWSYSIIFSKSINVNENLCIFVSLLVSLVIGSYYVVSFSGGILIFLILFFVISLIKR